MLTLPWRPHFYSTLHGWSEYSEVQMVVRGRAKSRRLWPIVIGRASEAAACRIGTRCASCSFVSELTRRASRRLTPPFIVSSAFSKVISHRAAPRHKRSIDSVHTPTSRITKSSARTTFCLVFALATTRTSRSLSVPPPSKKDAHDASSRHLSTVRYWFRRVLRPARSSRTGAQAQIRVHLRLTMMHEARL